MILWLIEWMTRASTSSTGPTFICADALEDTLLLNSYLTDTISAYSIGLEIDGDISGSPIPVLANPLEDTVLSKMTLKDTIQAYSLIGTRLKAWGVEEQCH